MTENHIEKVLEVEKECFLSAYPAKYFLWLLCSCSRSLWVAVEERWVYVFEREKKEKKKRKKKKKKE